MSLWKKLLWCAVTVLGLGAVCVLALSRGEQISALWIIVEGLCATSISYRLYSKWAWTGGPRQRVGDMVYRARCTRAARAASPRATPVGRFHHWHDHTGRIDHGNRLTHGKSECSGGHDFRIARTRDWRLGWTICHAL